MREGPPAPVTVSPGSETHRVGLPGRPPHKGGEEELDVVYALRNEPREGSLHFRIPAWIGSPRIGVSCLMDSGATCNLISSAVVSRAGLPTVPGNPVRLLQADGSPVSVSSYCELQIALEGRGPWGCVALVAPLLSCEVILGCPFMREHGGHLEFAPELRLVIPLPHGGERITLVARRGTDPHDSLVAAVEGAPVAPPFGVFQSPSEIEFREGQMKLCSFTAFERLLPRIESDRVRAVVADFRSVFPDQLPRCLPPDRGPRNHSIDLIPGKRLPQQRSYPMAEASKVVLFKKLSEMLEAQVLRPSVGTPRAVSAGFLANVVKPRLVGDYRVLNEATVDRAQDVPTVQEILDLLALAVWFSVVDMRSGFHQLRIKEEDQDLTTLSTPHGRFCYTVTAMGLKNAPTDFQRAVEAPLRATGGYGKWLSNYIDDILAFSLTEEEHAGHVRQMLEALRDDLWSVTADKIQLAVRRIHLLGHWVQAGLVYPDSDYIQKVRDLPSPDTLPNKIKGLQCLLGLFGYYRRFIGDFGALAVPLTNLLRKDTPWKWGEAEESARTQLSDRLQAALDHGLLIFRASRPIRITTDASGAGLGATLEQCLEDGSWGPVAFHSVALSPVEARLLNYERELLAIFSACKRWLPYLQGQRFTIRCDCAVLKNITSMSLLGRRRRVVNMLLFLRTLSFTWVHLPGKENAAADAFSRLHVGVPLDDSALLADLPAAPRFVGEEFPHESMDDEVEEYVASVFEARTPEVDFEEARDMLCAVVDGGSLPPLALPLESQKEKRGVAEEQVLFVRDCCRLQPMSDFLPWSEPEVVCFLEREFEDAFTCPLSRDREEEPDWVMAIDSTSTVPAQVEPGPTEVWDYATDALFGSTWARTASGPAGKYRRDSSGKLLMLKDTVVVPASAVSTVLADLHVGFGHIAKESLLRLVTDRGLWWPRRHKDVHAFVDACPTCRLKSLSRGIVFGSPGSRDFLDKGQEIAVDFTHIQPPSGGYDAVLGIVDRTSRFTMWVPASTSWTTQDFLRAMTNSWISIFGLPRIIRSDNGPTFTSKEWGAYWERAGCRVSHCAPYHPQGNGIVERSFRTLKDRLRALQAEDRFTSWVDMLPFIQGAANSLSRISLGGKSPAEITFGYSPRWECLPVGSALPPTSMGVWLLANAKRDAKLMSGLRAALVAADRASKAQRSKRHRPWVPKSGDLVLVKRAAVASPPTGSQLLLGFVGPVRVLSVLDHSVEIEWESASRRVAVAQLRPWAGVSGPPVQPTLVALWSLMASFRGSPAAPDAPGSWPSPDVESSSDEDDGWDSPPGPVLPASTPVPGVAIPSGVICDNLRTITSCNFAAGGRAVFSGKTVNQQKGTWFWAGLAGWDKDDWSITDQVLEYFKRLARFKRLSRKAFMAIVDDGALPGFLEETTHALSFYSDACAAWSFHEKKKDWSSDEVRGTWALWLRRASDVHKAPCPC